MATLAERLIAALGESFSVKCQEVNLGASVGVAIQDCQRQPCEVGQEVAHLLRRADEAMYRAKRDGSNQYVISSEP